MAKLPAKLAFKVGGQPPEERVFFRALRHLLPRARAWRLTVDKTLRSFFSALATLPEEARGFVDLIYLDLFPDTTRQLAEWERQFGIQASGSDSARRTNLAAEWRATGGQSPRYLQDVVQAAGFDLYIHEWWSSGPPYVARDPRTYTSQPLIGTTQCGEPLAQCGESGARCDEFLANEIGYLVNADLTRRPPPPVPDDSSTWPFFLYWGAATFPNKASIPSSRRAELERLLLKLCPSQQWLVLLIEFHDEPAEMLTEGGDTMIDEGGDPMLTEGIEA